MQSTDSVRPLTEDQIAEAEKRATMPLARYLIATFRAEQEARQRAEAQRDRACKELRGFIAAAKLFDGFDESDSEYGQGAQDIAVEVADRARDALREIEGGSDV